MEPATAGPAPIEVELPVLPAAPAPAPSTRTRRQSAATMPSPSVGATGAAPSSEPRHSRRISGRANARQDPPPAAPLPPVMLVPAKREKEEPAKESSHSHGTRRAKAVAAGLVPPPVVPVDLPLPAPATVPKPRRASAASSTARPRKAAPVMVVVNGEERPRKHHNQFTKRRELEELAAQGLAAPPPPLGKPVISKDGEVKMVKEKHPNQWTKRRERAQQLEREKEEQLEQDREARAGKPAKPADDLAPTTGAHSTAAPEGQVGGMIVLQGATIASWQDDSTVDGASPTDTTNTGPASPVASFNLSSGPQPSEPTTATATASTAAPTNGAPATPAPIHGTRSSTGSLKVQKRAALDSVSSTEPGPTGSIEETAIEPAPLRKFWPPRWLHRSSPGANGPVGAGGPAEGLTLRDQDAKDEPLMVICAALASVDNRALCPKEIAEVIEERGWAKFPGSQPFAVVSSAIRTHVRRAETGASPYAPLLTSHDLVSLPSREEELCMGAIRSAKPVVKRGTLWFLSLDGAGFSNPFDGVMEKGVKRKRDEEEEVVVVSAAAKGKGKGPVQQPRAGSLDIDGRVKLRLKLRPSVGAADARLPAPMELDEDSDGDGSSSVDATDSEATGSDLEGYPYEARHQIKRQRTRSDGALPRLAAQQRLAMRSYYRQHLSEEVSETMVLKEGVMSPQYMFRPGFVPGKAATALFSHHHGSFDFARAIAAPEGVLAAQGLSMEDFCPAGREVIESLQPAFDYFPRASSTLGEDDEESDDGGDKDEDEDDYADAIMQRDGEEDVLPGVGPASFRRDSRRRSSLFDDPTEAPGADGDDSDRDEDDDTPATTPRSPAMSPQPPEPASAPGQLIDAAGNIRQQDLNVTLCPPRVEAAQATLDKAKAQLDAELAKAAEAVVAVSASPTAPSVVVTASTKKSVSLGINIPAASAAFGGFSVSTPTTPHPLPPMLSLADRMGYTSLCETRPPSACPADIDDQDLEGVAGSPGGSLGDDVAMVMEDDDDEVMMVGETSSRSSTRHTSRTPDGQNVTSRGSSVPRDSPGASSDSFDVDAVTGRQSPRHFRLAGDSSSRSPFEWGDTDTMMDLSVDTLIAPEGVAAGPEALGLEELDQVWEAASPIVQFSVKLEEEPTSVPAGEKEFLTCSSAPLGPSPPAATADTPSLLGVNGGLCISATHEETPSSSNNSSRGVSEGLLNMELVPPPAPATSSSEPSPSQSAPPPSATATPKPVDLTGPSGAVDLAALTSKVSQGTLLKPLSEANHPTYAAAIGRTLIYAAVVDNKSKGQPLALLRSVELDDIYAPSLLEALNMDTDERLSTTMDNLVKEGTNARLVGSDGDIPGIWLALHVARLLVEKRGSDYIKSCTSQFFEDRYPGRYPQILAQLSRIYKPIADAEKKKQGKPVEPTANPKPAEAASKPASAASTIRQAATSVKAAAPATRKAVAEERKPVPAAAAPKATAKVQEPPRPAAPAKQPVKQSEQKKEAPAAADDAPAPSSEGDKSTRRLSSRRAALDAKHAISKEAEQPTVRSSGRRARR